MAVDLSGKVCLITGADEGIGHGIARGFARRGAQVVAGCLNTTTERPWPDEIVRVAMDVTKASDVDTAIAEVVQRFGRIDVLVNNAGIYPRQPADIMTFESWRRVLDVNLDGVWRCVQAVIPVLKGGGGGVILNVGSIALHLGMPNLAHYNASKGGIVGLTRALARDLGRFSIRVNCIHLGAVMTEGERRTHGDPAEVLRLIEEKQALRGRLTPETVEPVFAFLASDESADITGQCLTVDRGWTHR